ncbi:hypothetical protein [Gracilibacillus saliphilus]|uniref:hypothetical protein n=1 Tax=Gracilibacillus saliphilus TaxID=543890 RepID=UPI0013D01BC4|nr:hypothetical protein [Gracilibacillus saliphilus]
MIKESTKQERLNTEPPKPHKITILVDDAEGDRVNHTRYFGNAENKQLFIQELNNLIINFEKMKGWNNR